MAIIQTDYKELYVFAKNLDEFASELEYQMGKLVSETNNVTGYSWRGRQAEDFAALINDTDKDMQKQIESLRELVDAINEKARDLEEIANRKFK